jgi:hypothetical protein
MEENKKELLPFTVETLLVFKKLYCINREEIIYSCDGCLFSDKGFCMVNRFITKYGTNEQVKRMNDFIRKD